MPPLLSCTNTVPAQKGHFHQESGHAGGMPRLAAMNYLETALNPQAVQYPQGSKAYFPVLPPSPD